MLHNVKLFVIANRIIDIILTLIHRDQSGFIKGRQTEDSTRHQINVINHANWYKMPSLLLSLKAKKAFDRVYWSYLMQTLETFGFHCHILSLIMSLYSKPSAQVYCSAMLSTSFPISNGTRQGCPLPPHHFNLLMGWLAQKVCFHQTILGFPIGHRELKINLFADDVIFMLTNSDSSLAVAQTTLSEFNLVSYYKVNTFQILHYRP